jgi:hypothetical protein
VGERRQRAINQQTFPFPYFMLIVRTAVGQMKDFLFELPEKSLNETAMLLLFVVVMVTLKSFWRR